MNIEDVENQIVEKDITKRRKIRNIDTLERVMTYVINSYEAPTSLTNLTDHLSNVEHVPVQGGTLAAYIELLGIRGRFAQETATLP